MPIITQLLLIAVICTLAYAAFFRDGAPYRIKLPAVPRQQAPAPDHAVQTKGPAQAPTQSPTLSASVKVVVYVPDAHAETVREAIGEAGGGVIGNYSFVTFSSLGTGRYLPGAGANPMVGSVVVHERVEEERIEFTCSRENLKKVVETIKTVHPYEEIVIDIYPLEAHPDRLSAGAIHSH